MTIVEDYVESDEIELKTLINKLIKALKGKGVSDGAIAEILTSITE